MGVNIRDIRKVQTIDTVEEHHVKHVNPNKTKQALVMCDELALGGYLP